MNTMHPSNHDILVEIVKGLGIGLVILAMVYFSC